jgi:subtilase family serine protease
VGGGAFGALGALVLGAAVLVPAFSSMAGATAEPKVALPHSVPALPDDARVVGAPSGGQLLHLDVVLAGQNPSGLEQSVAAVSTPGSPEYHHFLSAAQYASKFGPTASEVAQVASALRSEGLTVGTPDPGSTLLPVSGTAAVVSSALGVTLQTVQVPNQSPALVNTSAPRIPASLAGVLTNVVGLDGLLHEHSMLKSPSGAKAVAGSSGGRGVAPPAGGAQSHSVGPRFGNPSCGAAANAAALPQNSGSYTSTQLASVYGLDQLFAQGRIGIGQTIAVVEFEPYLQSDYNAFISCYGLSNPIHNILVDGGAGSPGAGSGEAALDVELAAVNAPGASINVYEAPNNNDAQALDLYNRIASDDSAKVMTTSWGNCEPDILGSDPAYLDLEKGIFDRMAAQGQTMIAASGDSGSEDCFLYPNSFNKSLAVDDPGSQPDFISAGGTTLPSASEPTQSVWNSCSGAPAPSCAETAIGHGAAGGGVSTKWPTPPYQSGLPGAASRAVPDISYASDPNMGAVMAYWSGQWIPFGGTSVAAPTNAGLFADTNQGCYSTLGALSPSLYARASANTFFDVQSGNNDYTDSHPGKYTAGPGYDETSGLGTPIDQNLAIALQGAEGCPAVASVSPNTGPVADGAAITIGGGGFANATAVVFGAVGNGQIVNQTETSITVVPPHASQAICVDVTVVNSQGVSVKWTGDHYGFGGDLNCGQGYRFVASDGGIFAFGSASFWGSAGGMPINAPVVGMADTPSTNGYWLVASDGGIFAYGDAQFYGSMGGRPLNRPIVGITSTPNGGGYWEVASDGGIFSFGNAQFYGSTGAMRLNRPIVGMASTPDGQGYWLVASDGGIFAYGDAQFYGSTGSLVLNRPIVGMAPGPGGNGYWLVASDGGIFTFGSAQFYGSMGGRPLNQPVVGMAATPDRGGYWEVAADGGIFTFGDAAFFGSTGGIHLNKPIVGMSSA